MDKWMERLEVLEREARAARREVSAARREARLWRIAAGLFAMAVLVLIPLRAGIAQGGGSQAGGLPALEKRVAALEGEVSNQTDQITALQAALAAETAARKQGDADTLPSAKGYTDQQVAGVQNQVTPLTTLFLAPNAVNGQPYFQRVGGEITITGANLHIVNGLGATNGNPANPASLDPAQTVVNALGNLIVGYNEPGNTFGDTRAGSHNLVVGVGQSFSSFGGLVAGNSNTISGPFASVSGGWQNIASGEYASVSGGEANTAVGAAASVSGGEINIASGGVASVSGGQDVSATDPSGWAAGATPRARGSLR
jgi:hypothetical protein